MNSASKKTPYDQVFQTIITNIENLAAQSASGVNSQQSETQTMENLIPPELDSESMNDQDWAQLDEILSVLLASFQAPAVQQEPLQNVAEATNIDETPPNEIPSSLVPGVINPQPDTGNVKELFPSIQEMVQTSAQEGDQRQILQGLTDLLENDEKAQGKMPNQLREKLQLILSQLQQGQEKDQGIVRAGVAANLSLDKNQLFTPVELKNAAASKSGRFIHLQQDHSPPASLPQMASTSLQGLNARIQEQAKSQPAVVTAPELPSEISSMAARLVLVTGGKSGSTEAVFSLYPQHLGHVEVKIFSQAGQISAQIMAGTAEAKEALQGQLQHLRSALLQQGLQVDRLDVIQQPPSASAGLAFSQGGAGTSQQQNFHSSKGTTKKQKDADQTDLEKESLSIAFRGPNTNKTSHIDFTA